MSRSSWFAVVAVAALALTTTAAATPLRSNRELDEGIGTSHAALNGKVHARVILPANSRRPSGAPFPGHLFPARTARECEHLSRQRAWLVDAMAQVGPAILVLPQGARDADTDPEYLNWGSGRNGRTTSRASFPATSTRTSARSVRGRDARSSACPRVGTARRSSACIIQARSRSSSRGPATSTPTDRTGRNHSLAARRRTRTPS